MDDQLFLDIESASDEEPFRPRLQCWDFPGQNDYAQCNLLYFHGRGIYLAFVDVSQQLDDAWPELRFWLWAIAQHAHDDYAPTRKSTAAPPVLLIGTKWSRKQLDEQALDSLVDSFLDYLPRLKTQLQMGPGVSESCRSKWIFPVENFAVYVESYIRPLRERLNELAAELLLPARQDAVNTKAHAGLQSQKYPVAWLRAHDLLTGLADGMDLTVPRAQLEEQFPPREMHAASPGPSKRADDLLAPSLSFNLKSDEPLLTHSGERMLVPQGARVQVLGFGSGNHILVKVSCMSLGLSQVKMLLAGLRPRPIIGEDVERVLSLLHALGTLFWFHEEGLKENVLLAIRNVSVALSRVISLRFWNEKRLQHAEVYKKELLMCVSTASLRRLSTEGLVKRDLLESLWTHDFCQGEGKERKMADGMTDIMLKIMEQKGLILKRAFEDDFIVPCCLPASILPESAQEACKARYLNLEGLVSPAILTQIAADLCGIGRGSIQFTPGPPQIFRNDVELTLHGHSMNISLSPALGFQLLRLRVKSPMVTSERTAEAEKSRAETRANMMNLMIASFFECLGMDTAVRSKLVFTHDDMRVNPGPFLRQNCMQQVVLHAVSVGLPPM